MMSKLRVLIIGYLRYEYAPRIKRQIEFINKNFEADIDLVTFSSNVDINNVNHITLKNSPRSFFGKLRKALFMLFRYYPKNFDPYVNNENLKNLKLKGSYDLIIVHDLKPIKYIIEKYYSLNGKNTNTKLIVDLYEYYPSFSNELIHKIFYRPYLVHLTSNYLRMADYLIVVSNAMKEKYLQFNNNIAVIYNLPKHYKELEPTKPDDKRIKLVHVGAAIKERKLEKLLQIAERLENKVTLHLYLIPTDRKYYRKLSSLSRSIRNVYFNQPIEPFEKIPEVINKYDVGVHLLEPTNENFIVSCPNKLFDYIQARLMCLFSPSYLEANEIINKYKLGIVLNSFDIDEAVRVLNSLKPEQIYYYKQNASEASNLFHCGYSEEEMLKLLLDLGFKRCLKT